MPPITEHQLHRFFTDQATKEEIDEILNWLADGEADFSVLERYVASRWDGREDAVDADMDARLMDVFRNRLYPGKQVQFYKRPGFRYAIAASLVPMALAGGLYIFRNFLKPGNASKGNWTSIVNPDSRAEKVVLPDSTRVWLGPGGKLSYPQNFLAAENREVRLEGEAFFEVVRAAAHPFMVHNGHIYTTVLGTAFNVEAYQGEPNVRISLITGKVVVRKDTGNTSPQFLEPNEMLEWNKNNDQISEETISTVNVNEWEKGYMVFNDVPLMDALDRVAVRHHVKISYGKGVDVSGVKITTILRDDPLNELSHIFPFVTPFQYKLEKDTLYVTKAENTR